MTGNEAVILSIRDLRKYFVQRKGMFAKKTTIIKAVDGVSLSIRKGEVLGLVGESGCGKTTFGRTIARLYEPSSGDVVFHRFSDKAPEEIAVNDLDKKGLKRFRQDMQVIFQDPYSSLNARWDVKSIVSEPLVLQGIRSKSEINDRVADLLSRVGLSAEHMQRYPHEFSGGQRQRIGIARALALGPKLIIADEPVSALDVSIQAQVLNLLEDLKDEFDLTYIFIAHDLLVVEYVSDRVAVMYLGKIVELCESADLYRRPYHPYTEALLSAVPVPNPRYKVKRILLQGDVPSPANVPPGCPFHPRCNYAKSGICDSKIPDLVEVETGHFTACLRAKELTLTGLQELVDRMS